MYCKDKEFTITRGSEEKSNVFVVTFFCISKRRKKKKTMYYTSLYKSVFYHLKPHFRR